MYPEISELYLYPDYASVGSNFQAVEGNCRQPD